MAVDLAQDRPLLVVQRFGAVSSIGNKLRDGIFGTDEAQNSSPTLASFANLLEELNQVLCFHVVTRAVTVAKARCGDGPVDDAVEHVV